MQEVLDAQKRFVDSCQRVQLDDPTHVADVLDKLIDSLINKYDLCEFNVTVESLVSSWQALTNKFSVIKVKLAISWETIINIFINYRTASTFRELQNIQVNMRNHDTKVMKLIGNRPIQVNCWIKWNTNRNFYKVSNSEIYSKTKILQK